MAELFDEDMLLENRSAKKLYHEFAEEMPIFDFHTHLNPHILAANENFHTITDAWLSGDHYKWRAMRWLGEDEKFITGNADKKEKFLAWAACVPKTAGNPLYVWTRLELKRYFGIEEALSPANAEKIWHICNEKLQDLNFSPIGLLKKFSVKALYTTDDPIDSLLHHEALRNSEVSIYPAFRPDKALTVVTHEDKSYMEKLSAASGRSIQNYDDFLAVLSKRMDLFHQHGCRISDHGLEKLPLLRAAKEDAYRIFDEYLHGKKFIGEEAEQFQLVTLLHLAEQYHSLNWAMQLHIGGIRNNNSKGYSRLGPDSGYDSMLDFSLARPLNRYLNQLHQQDTLPKTIFYNLNPAHNEVIASAIGNFQGQGVKGKLQFGAGWWFNDHKDGIQVQLKCLSNIGCISTFIGMLTDSRSFLSFPRHEYFRRILCNVFGSWMEAGELPKDFALFGSMIQDICYNNARDYFGLEQEGLHVSGV